MNRILSLRNAAIASLGVAVVAISGAADTAHASRYCDNYARDVADRRAGNAGGEAVRGGVTGAIGGAIIGGIIDGGRGAGRGALIGGGVGVLGGAAHGSSKWRRVYDRAYRRCERDRRRPAAYRGGGRPAAGTPEWYDYCASKYRSFNPDTGYYRTYSGKYRRCR